jgi:Predicted integral membrane protein
MFAPTNPFIWLILQILELYSWVVLAAVVMSWLLAFNVVNYHNNIVRGVSRFLDVLTEPVFRQVRRVIPAIGGLDLSPIVVFLAIIFLQKLIVWVYVRYLPF